MIAMIELVQDYAAVPVDHRVNLDRLYFTLSHGRRLSKLPFHINDEHNLRRGYRTQQQHLKLYEEINERRMELGQRPIKVPTESMHLIGAAADIADSGGKLKRWILENSRFSERFGIYYEHFDATGGMNGGWVHWQIYPPASGVRFFLP